MIAITEPIPSNRSHGLVNGLLASIQQSPFDTRRANQVSTQRNEMLNLDPLKKSILQPDTKLAGQLYLLKRAQLIPQDPSCGAGQGSPRPGREYVRLYGTAVRALRPGGRAATRRSLSGRTTWALWTRTAWSPIHLTQITSSFSYSNGCPPALPSFTERSAKV